MDDLHKEEVTAKAASNSLEVLDKIMQVIRNTKRGLICPDYRSFLELINDPKNADIKEILDKTKEEIHKAGLDRQELRKEILKQRNELKERG
jgi:hypothetical protein